MGSCLTSKMELSWWHGNVLRNRSGMEFIDDFVEGLLSLSLARLRDYGGTWMIKYMVADFIWRRLRRRIEREGI